MNVKVAALHKQIEHQLRLRQMFDGDKPREKKNVDSFSRTGNIKQMNFTRCKLFIKLLFLTRIELTLRRDLKDSICLQFLWFSFEATNRKALIKQCSTLEIAHQLNSPSNTETDRSDTCRRSFRPAPEAPGYHSLETVPPPRRNFRPGRTNPALV